MQIVKIVLLLAFAYFIGNINFALLLSKRNQSDITKTGSGNPGAINMLRTHGIKLGGLTLMLDILKGAIPALFAFYLMGGVQNAQMATTMLYWAGLFVVIGHIFPVMLKFKGGKGVAATLGIFLVANPLATIVIFVLGLIYLWFFEYGSVASLFMITSLVLFEGIRLGAYQNIFICLALLGLLFLSLFAHRQNIKRLLKKSENKLSLKALLNIKNNQ